MENAHINCEELFTAEVLRVVKPRAEKWAKRTHGALSADDLMQAGVLSLWRTRYTTPIQDATRALTARVHREYLTWVNGTNSRFGPRSHAHEVSPRQQYMSAVEYPADDGARALTHPEAMAWEMPLDIERALHTLNAEELQLVRWKYWEGLDNVEIGARLGLTNTYSTVRSKLSRQFTAILEKLRPILAVYESPAPAGKRLHG